MAKVRVVNTRFWIDDYISNLDPVEKLLFLYFLTNPATDICGIYEIPLKNVALDTGIDKEMVIKILKRFTKDKRIVYLDGWVIIVNFAKHQIKNPSVESGIKRSLDEVPKKILDKLYTVCPQSGLPNLTKPNLTKPNLTKPTATVASDTPFSLKEEITKLEDSDRRDFNIIALYLEHRKPTFENKKQYEIAFRRHLKPAGVLKDFSNPQILKALDYAKKEYKEIYTLETLMKILTK